MATSPGHVYLVQMVGHPLFKIGRTVDVPRRMSDFGILLPFPYQLIFARKVTSSIWAEGVIHSEYEHLRTNGEWFALAAKDIERVNHLLLYWQSYDLFKRLVALLTESASSDVSAAYLSHVANLITRAYDRVSRREILCGQYSFRAVQQAEGVQ